MIYSCAEYGWAVFAGSVALRNAECGKHHDCQNDYSNCSLFHLFFSPHTLTVSGFELSAGLILRIEDYESYSAEEQRPCKIPC